MYVRSIVPKCIMNSDGQSALTSPTFGRFSVACHSLVRYSCLYTFFFFFFLFLLHGIASESRGRYLDSRESSRREEIRTYDRYLLTSFLRSLLSFKNEREKRLFAPKSARRRSILSRGLAATLFDICDRINKESR